MERFIALTKIEWYDESEEEDTQKIKTDYLVLTSITSFEEAIKEVEEYYDKDLNDLNKVEIELFEGPYLTVSKETYEAIYKEKN